MVSEKQNAVKGGDMEMVAEDCPVGLERVNVPLLREVQKAILTEPKRVDMDCFLTKQSKCGTVGCIAGWAVVLRQKHYLIGDGRAINEKIEAVTNDIITGDDCGSGIDFLGEGSKLLGVTYEQADRLFYPDMWPDEFSERLMDESPQTMAYAQVVSDRIDHFIETGE